MLEVFFFSWLWASLREFPRVSILSTKSQVINHFPEVSVLNLLGALVKSWSPSHCFIMKSLITMSKKGTETPPPPEGV